MSDIICPAPIETTELITLAHGGGGRMMHRLIQEEVFSRLRDVQIDCDAATVPNPGEHYQIAITTDSFVVDPIFFPGGDIGKLAIDGTVNDLACSGAIPLYLTLSLVIEEGLALSSLRRVLDSIAAEARVCNVKVVTGDTKVVPRGFGGGLYINTAGVGKVPKARRWHPDQIQGGDHLIVTGDLGRHGLAIMGARNDLFSDGDIQSDTASIFPALAALADANIQVKCARDMTRGGLAGVLREWLQLNKLGFRLVESQIPQDPDISQIAELLGLNPLHLSNEGRCALVVPAEESERAVAILRDCPDASGAAIIGEVVTNPRFPLELITAYGVGTPIAWPAADPLPRIC